jgi:hypothetical protein
MILQNRQTQNKLDPNPPRWPTGETLEATMVVVESVPTRSKTRITLTFDKLGKLYQPRESGLSGTRIKAC